MRHSQRIETVVPARVPSEGVDVDTKTKEGKTDRFQQCKSSDQVLVRCFLLEPLRCRNSGEKQA